MRVKGFLAKAAALLLLGASTLLPVNTGAKAQATTATATPEFEIPNQGELGDMLEGIYRNSHDNIREAIVDSLSNYDVRKINSLNGTEYRFFDRNTHTAYVFASSEYVLTTDVAGTDECNPVTTEATDCETPTEKRIAIDVYTNVDGFGHLANELNGHARKSRIEHKKRYDVVTIGNFEATTITLTKNPSLVAGYEQSPVPVSGERNKLIYVGGQWVDIDFYEDGIENAKVAAQETLTHYAQDLIAVQGIIDATTEAYEEERTEITEARIALRAARTAEEDADLARRIELAGIIPEERKDLRVVYLPTESSGASLPRITRGDQGNYRVIGNPDGADAAGVRRITNKYWNDDGNLEVSARYVFKCGPGAANQRRFNVQWVYSHSPDNNVHVVINPLEAAEATAPDCIYEFDIEVEGIPRNPNPEVFQEGVEYLIGGDAPTVYTPTTAAGATGTTTTGVPGSTVTPTASGPTGPCTAPMGYTLTAGGRSLEISIDASGAYSINMTGLPPGNGTLDATQLQTLEQSLEDNGFSGLASDLSGTCPGAPFEHYVTATCGGTTYRVGGECALDPLMTEIMGDISTVTGYDIALTAPGGP